MKQATVGSLALAHLYRIRPWHQVPCGKGLKHYRCKRSPIQCQVYQAARLTSACNPLACAPENKNPRTGKPPCQVGLQPTRHILRTTVP